MTTRILGIGIPSAFETSLFEAGRILVVSMISTFGTVQIAANAMANNLDGMGAVSYTHLIGPVGKDEGGLVAGQAGHRAAGHLAGAALHIEQLVVLHKVDELGGFRAKPVSYTHLVSISRSRFTISMALTAHS